MANSQMIIYQSGAIERSPSKRRVAKLARRITAHIPLTSAYRKRRARIKARRQAEKELLLEQARDELRKVEPTPVPHLAKLLDVGESPLLLTDPIEVSAEDLKRIIANGRDALDIRMIENGVPLQANTIGPNRRTAQSTELLKHQLDQLGIINEETIETLKEELTHHCVKVVQNAANLLAGMVLDNKIFDDRTRQKALVALISASKFSNESREMLQQFGFSAEITSKAASALSSQSKQETDSRRIGKKSRLLFWVGVGGAIVSSVTRMDGLFLVVSAIVAGLGLLSGNISSRRRVKRIAERNEQIGESALNKVDEFKRLLTVNQRTALPPHE